MQLGPSSSWFIPRASFVVDDEEELRWAARERGGIARVRKGQAAATPYTRFMCEPKITYEARHLSAPPELLQCCRMGGGDQVKRAPLAPVDADAIRCVPESVSS
jgi:hypothetical protein